MPQDTGNLTISPYSCPADILVTARSHLVDRFVPACEIIQLPEKSVDGGTLSYELTNRVLTSQAPKKQRFSLKRRQTVQQKNEHILVDFRLRFPENWAHFLNNHLPILFALIDETGLRLDELRLILPENIPGYIIEAARFFGFSSLATDADIEGRNLAFEADPWTGIRPMRFKWAQLDLPRSVLARSELEAGEKSELPKRAFLSRRKTRALENEAEIEALLARHGFEKLYPEDLSVADQFRLFEEAEEIVAIHGAALAPLLYRSDNSQLIRVIELFPCGHMTDVYRVMCHQVGCRWIGVRGRIKPEHIAGAYDLEKPFLEYSLQSFSVDPKSLEIALEIG